jgi:hypothetical protein
MRVVIAVVAMLVTGTAHNDAKKESAFGFWKGMTVKKAKAAAPLEKMAAFSYKTASPPQPVWPFTHYSLTIGPKAGVCIVVAMTGGELEGSHEHDTKLSYVIGALRERYGEPTTVTDDEWKWVNAQGANTAVDVQRGHYEGGKVNIGIRYEFSNVTACKTETMEGL